MGKCVANLDCKGASFTNQEGKSEGIGDAKGLLDALKGIMDALKGKGGGGKGGEQPEQQPQQQCTSYYQVTAPSTDPCAYYVPPISDSLLGDTTGIGSGTSDALLDALEGGGALNVSDQILGAVGAGPDESKTDGSQGTATTTTTAGDGLGVQTVNLQAGTQGNIELTATRATLIARTRDTEANTEVAGFYGSTATGGEQSQGVVARLCQSRPWADSIVTYIIPPSFFDGLCTWRGYQVGAPPPPTPPAVLRKEEAKSVATTTSTAKPINTVTPEVDIWAVPEKVPLGARTTIFWNTKGVETCTVTSPDGSFEEHALSGGAATVPLSGATTFSISCLAPDGTPVTDSLTVELSI